MSPGWRDFSRCHGKLCNRLSRHMINATSIERQCNHCISLLLGDSLVPLIGEADVLPIKAKTTPTLHSSCVTQENEGRNWVNAQSQLFAWESSENLLTYMKCRKSMWKRVNPHLQTTFDIVKTWQGPEGVRIAQARLMILVPGKGCIDSEGRMSCN